MIKVRFHISHPLYEKSYGNVSEREVTDYCKQVSWSYSTQAPYESMNLLLEMPIEAYRNREVIPLVEHEVPDTGFWVTICEDSGPLLSWGRVDTVTLGMNTDMASGGVVCSANITVSSWVWFLEDHSFLVTNFEYDATSLAIQYSTNKALLPRSEVPESLRGTEAGEALSAISDITTGLLIGSDPLKAPDFSDPKKYASVLEQALYYNKYLINGDEFHQLTEGIFKSLKHQNADLNQIKLSTEALRIIFKTFAGRVSLPKSLGGGNIAKQVPIIPGNVSKVTSKPAHSSEDLAKFGYASSVPPGYTPNYFLVPESGTWSAISSTFIFDNNYMELFPTLIMVSADEGKERQLLAQRDESSITKKPHFPFSPKTKINGKEVQMMPCVMYRMKPIGCGGARIGNNYTSPVTGQPLQPFKLEGENAFSPETDLSKFGKTYHEISADNVLDLTYQVSENKKFNFVTTRRPYDGIPFGYGLDNIRPPEIISGRVQGHGIRYQEMGWGLIHGNEEVYQYLNEYLYTLVNNLHLGAGSLEINYYPAIRAGQYIRIRGEDSDLLKSMVAYVEEVTHSVRVRANGEYDLDTSIKFSSALLGDNINEMGKNFGTADFM